MCPKTLAFGETCYRKAPSGDVVAEDGEGVSGSQALSLRVAEDAALVRAAASEPSRFAALYRLYVDDLYRYLLSRCGDAADAEDLVAETFLAAFRSARGYRGSGPVKAWLVGIARRKAADARRDRRPHVGLEEARELVDPIRTDDVALRRIELARVVAMTGRLAPDRAEALRLRFFAGLECGEIATVMGRSEAAVKMLVHRALIDLRERLEATT
jgi:RNA polymerase sigma-70 factor (ECF subfamily)